MTEWISIKDRLPELSYFESDDENHPYECYPVLVFSEEDPGVQCVAHLVENQDQQCWNVGELSWETYVPGASYPMCTEIPLETFTHWMPLPNPPTTE